MNLLKKTVLVSAASLMVTSAFALTATESQVLTQKILASKVVDMPLVAAKLVVSADKADRIEVAKAAVVAVAKSHPTALSTVVGAILRKAPEATEAVVAACLEVAPQMARTVVAAATLATEGQDAVILATADRLVPAQQAEVRGEVTLAKSRRAMKTSTTAKEAPKTIVLNGNTYVLTQQVLGANGTTLPPGVVLVGTNTYSLERPVAGYGQSQPGN
jgi:hypothetical protein